MTNALEKFKAEVEKRTEALSETPTKEDLQTLELFTSIFAGLHHLNMMENSAEHNTNSIVQNENHSVWKDDIADELESADEKYSQYQKSGDYKMLEMARQELDHAYFYINQAKMSHDVKLNGNLSDYERKYEELTMKINNPHGAEKLPYL